MKKYIEYAVVVLVAVVVAVYALRPGTFGSFTGYSSLKLTPSASTGDTYAEAVNSTTTVDLNGNWASQILQTNTALTNVILGTTVFNNIVQGGAGFQLTISTSTTLTAAQFCAGTSIRVLGTPGAATITLPAATSSYVACGSPSPGAWSTQLVINDSTNTVTIAGGTGLTLMNLTPNGTSTLVTGSTANQIAATSSQIVVGIWDTSSTLYVMQGPSFH